MIDEDSSKNEENSHHGHGPRAHSHFWQCGSTPISSMPSRLLVGSSSTPRLKCSVHERPIEDIEAISIRSLRSYLSEIEDDGRRVPPSIWQASSSLRIPFRFRVKATDSAQHPTAAKQARHTNSAAFYPFSQDGTSRFRAWRFLLTSNLADVFDHRPSR